ncbi:unnamed protein product [Porites lobata]|uniref:Protein kinase domain-containing protein n=1 Tax=Porites lobata TaxID=104759 RepID=A0ABN8S5S9_9CNID|nr:unnamed protein product [Porites lobata]
MEDLREASVQTPAPGGDFPKPSREIRQHQANLERQLREMRQREESLQSQLRETQQREENAQRQLREMQQNSQRQLREMQQREQNLQSQLREMQQRFENSQQRVSTLERQLRDKDQEVNELVLSLSLAQQTISEQQQQESCDWVISRDEIQMTNKCLGRGGWGNPRRREQQVLLMTNHVLRGLVRRCLQTDPEARPTMQRIIDELSRSV